MRKLIIILFFLTFLSLKMFSQGKQSHSYNHIQRYTVDSILKSKNYKEGDSVSLKAIFEIDSIGEPKILRIEAPDEMFKNEIVFNIQKMKPFGKKYHNNRYEYQFYHKIKFSDIKYHLYNTENSKILDDDIWSIEIDKKGNKWIGTSKKGLIKFDGKEWRNFNKDNSIVKGSFINPIFSDSKNNLWLTYSKPDALLMFNGEKWKQLVKSETKLRQSPIKITEKNGIIYLGGFNELVKYNGKHWEKINLPKGNYTIRAIAVDNDGTIAIGHNNGLLIRKNLNWTTYRISKQTNKLQNYVRSLKFLNKGKLFIGYGGNADGGFSILENTNWIHYNKSNSKLSDNMVRDIEIDGNGVYWLATNDGLNKVDKDGLITPIFFYEEHNVTMISDIAIEGNTIWVATNFGLIEIKQ